MNQQDIRHSKAYEEAEALYRAIRRPGTAQISDAVEVHTSPDGKYAAFTATLFDTLDATPATRIGLTELVSGDTRIISHGSGVDRLPKFSPDGRYIAFLSDRRKSGDFQLHLLDIASGATREAPTMGGWVEYFHWSPDGGRILLGVAGYGADIAGTQGAVSSNKAFDKALRSWMPEVETGDETYRWRSACVYDIRTGHQHQVSKTGDNVWEAAWLGNDGIAAIVSPGPSEGLWYSARLQVLSIHTDQRRELYAPQNQLGWPAGAPSGKHLAFVEAVCSDRWIVVGDLRLVDVSSGEVRRIDTHGVDITTTEWRSDRLLLLAGIRGFETVIGTYDVLSDRFTETWCSREVSSFGSFINLSGFGSAGDCVLVTEGFKQAPEIGVIRSGVYHPSKSFDVGYAEQVRSLGPIEHVSWSAPDGLEIQGWLLRPVAPAPHPVVMNVHGGPVSNWRPAWLGRPRTTPMLMLLQRGYAVFLPNPRGSSGRGQDFARRVRGDLGGKDTYDYLSGLDRLVELGLADAKRLGVIGISYGGYMTAWLTTHDARFAAAIAVAPVTNRVSQRLSCAHPNFVDMFLDDRYDNPNGRYFQRSPIMHASRSKTPTLNICGALDRCTPPQEALQFHNALREHGTPSVLVTYPEEGHGVRKFPASIDYAARVVAWFDEHLR